METARTSRGSLLLSCLLAFALAFGLAPAFAPSAAVASEAPQGASARTAAAEQNVASLELFGTGDDASSSVSIPLTEWAFEDGATAADLTEALFAAYGIAADIQDTEYGFYLNSITAPDGTVYGWDEATGAYWGLYVNGVSSEVGAGSVELKPGDVVSWYYGPYGKELPNQHPGFAPDAPLTDYESAWPGYAGENAGAAAGVLPIMEQSAKASWQQTLLRTEGGFANASDPLVIDGMVFVAESDSVWTAGTSNAVLRAYDAQTGELKKTMELPFAVGSTCRMAYADGVIAVPTSDGGLLGVAADTLAPRWYVAPELSGAQSLSKVTVHDGYFVHTYAQLDGNWAAAASRTVAVNVQTGALKWNVAAESGSYWSGAAFVGETAVVGTDAGTLRTIDFATGAVLDEEIVADGARVRSVPVVCGQDEVVVSTSAGSLVKARIGADGGVTVAGSVQFAASSTSTPALSGSTAVVGGATADYQGVLAEVDVASMKVTATHAAPADVKSAPVVAQGVDGASYAYYTCNTMPGALYGVELASADAQPFVVFEPAAADRNYCMASPASDGEGNLFYTNDSGVLFAISHDATCGYPDVAATDWYVQDGLLERAVAQGLIGRGVDAFRPWEALTRAEVVTVIYRAAGEPAVSAGEGFVDVAEGEWYADAVLWAQASGVATGYGDGSGKFGPNDPVTREQLATMLGNYASKVSDADVDGADPTAFDSFPDRGSVAEWARPGFVWCCANGIVTGSVADGVSLLDPLGSADRAMMAKMILLTVETLSA